MILAVDIGTSSMKGALISPEGYLFSYHRVSFISQAPSGGESFSALIWVDAFREIVAKLGSINISAIAISGHGPSLVPVDKQANPLAPVLFWHEKKSSGHELTSSYYLPKIHWLKRFDRELYSKTDFFLSCPEYLYRLLTGRSVMVCPTDSFRKFIWQDHDFSAMDLDASKFPEQVMMGDLVALVSSAGSESFGIKQGTPVVACGSDFMVSLLGTAAVEPGRVCDRAGTSEGLNYCSPHGVGDPCLRELPHAIEGYTNVSAILSSTGSLFEWYRRLTGQERFAYEDTMNGIEKVDVHQKTPYFFPSLKGENLWEFSYGTFAGLQPHQGRFEMGRAVLESIGFALKRAISIYNDHDMAITELRVSGGQAKSRKWNEMKADITGCSILIPEIEDAELLGCAIIASYTLGRYSSVSEASKALVKIKYEINPRLEYNKVYDGKFLAYQDAVLGAVDHFKSVI